MSSEVDQRDVAPAPGGAASPPRVQRAVSPRLPAAPLLDRGAASYSRVTAGWLELSDSFPG